MSEELELKFPKRGLADRAAYGDQPPLTTRVGKNVRLTDPATGRDRGAQRAGLTKYCSEVVGADSVGDPAPITHIAQTIHDSRKIVYGDVSPDGETSALFSKELPAKSEARAMAFDRQSNTYWVDGNQGIIKYNPTGARVLKLALPGPTDDQFVRAIAIAPDDRIYAGISGGGLQTNGRLWCYRQTADDGTEQQWELKLNAYVERMKVRNGLLYTVQNMPDRYGAELVVYRDIDSAVPVVAWRKTIPYPCNDIDVFEDDGGIVTAHEAFASRGLDPRFPAFTQKTEDWTPKDLTDYDKRIWSWYAADKITGFENGDQVSVLEDLGGLNRHLYNTAAQGNKGIIGGLYTTSGPGGKPSVHLTASGNTVGDAAGNIQPGSYGYNSFYNASTDANYTEQSATMIPTHKGSKWAMFILVRVDQETTAVVRPVVTQNDTSATAGMRLYYNREATAGAPGTAINGLASIMAATNATYPGGSTVGSPLHCAQGDYGRSGLGTGMALFSVVWDNNLTNDNATPDNQLHGIYRVNGRPIDRLVFAKLIGTELTRFGGANTAGGTYTGVFDGDICEIITFREYLAGGVNDPLSCPHYPRTIGNVVGPTSTAVAWSSGSDTELERIEGYLMHKWGCAHILPTSYAADLVAAGTNWSAADTVTIGGHVYTFRATISTSSVADEVLIGSSRRESLINLASAINGTGERGVDYGALTVTNVDYRATIVDSPSGVGTSWMRIEGRSSATAQQSLATSKAGTNWYGGSPYAVLSGADLKTQATVATQVSSTDYHPGHYPHPFFKDYGPPRKTGVSVESVPFLLHSTYPILAKWSANGELKWVLTSRAAVSHPPAQGGTAYAAVTFGGIGYACKFLSNGSVVSYGDIYDTSTTETKAILRRVSDKQDSYSTSGADGAWTMYNGTITEGVTTSGPDYKYPYVGIDTHDNIYIPWYETSAGGTGLVLNAVIVSKTGSVIERLKNCHDGSDGTINSPYGLVCLPDPIVPDLAQDSLTRAEFFYLGSALGRASEVADTHVVWKFPLLSTTSTGGSTRTYTNLAISAGNLRIFDDSSVRIPAGTDTLAQPEFDATSEYISSTLAFGKRYFTDGINYRKYDPKTDECTAWEASSAGTIPPRAKGLETWGGRVVAYRYPDDPHNWHMSAQSDPEDWDFYPAVPTLASAVTGNLALAGKCPDIINTVIPFNDNVLIFGCERSIWRLVGNPAGGAEFQMLTDQTGVAFGKPWIKDPSGVIFFIGTKGGAYILSPVGELRRLTKDTIESRIEQAATASSRFDLSWDQDGSIVHVMTVPFDASQSGSPTHFSFEVNSRSWFEDTFASVAVTAVGALEGDNGPTTVMGFQDGYIRRWDSSAKDDDGEPIRWEVMLGPVVPPRTNKDYRFSRLAIESASTEQECSYSVYATPEAEVLGSPVSTGTVLAGRNPIIPMRAKGGYLFLKLSGGTAGTHWALENIFVQVAPAGRRRGG